MAHYFIYGKYFQTLNQFQDQSGDNEHVNKLTLNICGPNTGIKNDRFDIFETFFITKYTIHTYIKANVEEGRL